MTDEENIPSMELERYNTAVERLDVQGRELASLIEQGDAETINEMREQGKVAALAAERLGFETKALELGRQALRCSAALGVIECKVERRGKRKTDLSSIIDRKSSSALPRSALAAAMDRGRLEAVFEAAGMTTNEYRVAQVARNLGVSGVNHMAVATLIRGVIADAGSNPRQIEREKGLKHRTLDKYLRDSDRATDEWWVARRITLALGIDISHLPTQKPLRRKRPPAEKPKWITYERVTTQGLGELQASWYELRDRINDLVPNLGTECSTAEERKLSAAMKTVDDFVATQSKEKEIPGERPQNWPSTHGEPPTPAKGDERLKGVNDGGEPASLRAPTPSCEPRVRD